MSDGGNGVQNHPSMAVRTLAPDSGSRRIGQGFGSPVLAPNSPTPRFGYRSAEQIRQRNRVPAEGQSVA